MKRTYQSKSELSYLCVFRSVDFTFFEDFPFRFWNCDNLVVFFVFHFIKMFGTHNNNTLVGNRTKAPQTKAPLGQKPPDISNSTLCIYWIHIISDYTTIYKIFYIDAVKRSNYSQTYFQRALYSKALSIKNNLIFPINE